MLRSSSTKISASSRPTSASGARAPRITLPAGHSRSSPRSTRSARCRRSTSRTSRWTRPGRLYEAYIKLLTGQVDTALVYGFGKSSAGTLRRVLALQTDPYTVAPLWPDSVSIAGLQARFGLDAGKWTAEQMAQVALDSFAVAERTDSEKLGSSTRQVHRRAAGPAVLRRSAAPPRHRADHRRCVGDRAGRGRQGPRTAREPGLDHRFRAPHRDAGAGRARPDHLAVDGGVGQGGHRRRRRLDRRRRDSTRRSPISS